MISTKRVVYVWLLLFAIFVRPAFALVPSVDNVVVWNSGGHTILNVTITHSPATPPSHYVNMTVISVGGINHTFSTPQPFGVTTFTASCDLGVIEGTPQVVVWAHCIVDKYSTLPYSTQIPEFSSFALLLALAFSTILVALAMRKIRSKHP